MRWSKSRRTRPRTDGVAISFHLDDATAKRLAVFLRCRRQELALLGHADCLPSCLLSGVKLPRQPAIGEAVDDPKLRFVNADCRIAKAFIASIDTPSPRS